MPSSFVQSAILPDAMGADQSDKHVYVSAPSLANSRYNRQMLIPSISLQGQQRISSSRVLIIGLGGLGSPASLYLAGAGVHTLGLLDHDVVEESNLHRQVVHRESSIKQTEPSERGRADSGASHIQPMSKVQSALRGCRDLNSTIQYQTYQVRLNGSNALDIVKEYDYVLDCTDNPATRYLISDVCVVLDKVLISGAAQRLDGQVMALNYAVPVDDGPTPAVTEHETSGEDFGRQRSSRGPCYRCVFPVPPAPEMVQGCSEIGILGPVVGTIGCLMASETLRLICRPQEARKPTMLLYNAWSVDPRGTFRTIGLRGRRQDCVSCGDAHVLREKGKQKLEEQQIREGTLDYEEFCGRIQDVCILKAGERIDAAEFLEVMQSAKKCIVVDVREQFEVELGPKINNSINIPISRILRGDQSTDQAGTSSWDALVEKRNDAPTYFVCQRGNDSQIAARKLIVLRGEGPDQSGWIGDVKGGFIAMENYANSSRT